MSDHLDPAEYAVWCAVAAANEVANMAKKRPLSDDERRDCERASELLKGASDGN